MDRHALVVSNPSRSSGFTLIELLVVISIISLLVAFLIPALSTARSVAYSGKCMSNLRSLGQGNFNYYADNKEYMIPLSATIGVSGLGLTQHLAWYNGPNAISGVANSGFMGSYVPAPLSGTDYSESAYRCPGDPFYLSQSAINIPSRITYNYSNLLQNGVNYEDLLTIAHTYYTSGGVSMPGWNRLSNIRTQNSNVGVFCDGFYKGATTSDVPTNNSAGAMGAGTITAKRAATLTYVLGVGIFGGFEGSDPAQGDSNVYYDNFHLGGNTNFSYLDGHCDPLNWEKLNKKFNVIHLSAYPLAYN